MPTKVCLLCRSLTAEKRCTSLFTVHGLQQRWESRINRILEVEVAADNMVPKHICCPCRTRLEVLERAIEDRMAFSERAKKIYRLHGPLKRTKVSSGDRVSPDTVRPPAKRLSSRRLDFGSSSPAPQCKWKILLINTHDNNNWVYMFATQHHSLHNSNWCSSSSCVLSLTLGQVGPGNEAYASLHLNRFLP